MTAKAIRCTERDKDGHRCTKSAAHKEKDPASKHTAFGKLW